MRIGDLFETKVEEKIEPVIKVGETADEHKLAGEIGAYVVTPLIERYLDSFLEHYTDTFFRQTTEIGVWISGYFGSGKSHLAKVMALLAQNRKLAGVSACDRFRARVPQDSALRKSLDASLDRMNQHATDVLGFNLNTVDDAHKHSLPGLLLSQYYQSLGYSTNLVYARVIEAELDRRGKLADLHNAVEARTNKRWADICRNLAFYSRHLYAAACEVAPDVFQKPEDVLSALQIAEAGDLVNVDFVVDTLLEGLKRKEKETGKPLRLVFVMDETGEWIGADRNRLAQMQAFIEAAAAKAQGRIWVILTTHGDMGSIYKEARALDGDMKKIEGRFRFKFGLTTENIELVLEDRLFRKTLAGRQEIDKRYALRAGVLRGLGELADVNQALPPCSPEKFATYYPFFPYQVHLIPEIVKTVRSKGGRGEQMSGSTRTLLAITQDILRAGRRRYLDEGIGTLVTFDEVYANLAGEGELSPDVRTDLSRIKDVVMGATELTPRVAEVLYLMREVRYVPRTLENIARLLAQDMDEDLASVVARVEPELQRLVKARMVAPMGGEYEYLTGESRTFEECVAGVEAEIREQDRQRGLSDHFVHGDGKAHWRRWLDFETVPYLGVEFPFRVQVDDSPVPGTRGDIALKVWSPLSALGAVVLEDLENRSLRADETASLLFLCGRTKGFDRDLTRYLAMREVIDNWKGDAHRSEDARKLAMERESVDLPKLEARVLDGLKEGIREGRLVFRGSSRALSVRPGQKGTEALRAELASFWPVLYPKLDRVPARVVNDQKAILDVLNGSANPVKDVAALKLYDKAGKLDPNCPLLDEIRVYLSAEQTAGRRVLGKELLAKFTAPPYGWDGNAVRVGVAALVRAGMVKVLINKKAYLNPADADLQAALRLANGFNPVELVLEDEEIPPVVLTETRTFLIKLLKRRNIDETPSALGAAAGELAKSVLERADRVTNWAEAAEMPLPAAFVDGADTWRKVDELVNQIHRVREVHGAQAALEAGKKAIEALDDFRAKESKRFIGLKQFKNALAGIEHLVDSISGIARLVAAFDTAHATASIAAPESWKQLQALKAQAELEVQALVEGWRAEARKILEEALARLPILVAQRQQDPALVESLSAPLQKLMDSLPGIVNPSQAAALPGRARKAARLMEEAIPQKQPEGAAPKKRRQVRMADCVGVPLVTSEEEWTQAAGKLDAEVRRLLAEGYDVELG